MACIKGMLQKGFKNVICYTDSQNAINLDIIKSTSLNRCMHPVSNLLETFCKMTELSKFFILWEKEIIVQITWLSLAILMMITWSFFS